jgi:hypothetical protein
MPLFSLGSICHMTLHPLGQALFAFLWSLANSEKYVRRPSTLD